MVREDIFVLDVLGEQTYVCVKNITCNFKMNRLFLILLILFFFPNFSRDFHECQFLSKYIHPQVELIYIYIYIYIYFLTCSETGGLV
jgi:hypothetical protein